MLHAASPAPGFCLSYPRNLHCPRDSTEPSIRARSPVCCSVPETKNGATKVEYTPWLVVGLGNPGNKYHGTRLMTSYLSLVKKAWRKVEARRNG
ncbi:Chloroplastic group IIB intron splicing facilitator CRS2-B [Arachis hypogaea]|uniref:Chloroplastic group IIB intron splicing facilitator CRS2-B n=1 Tax=Arachis hypogaea TaxID=3818 RepID=A0A6B9VCA2_ARAHY|nr:Chloroplastic group IIB intron splicing facilitator CRS2-B [Arachis hypogaea]